MTDEKLMKHLRDLGDRAAFEPHMYHIAADRIELLKNSCEMFRNVLEIYQRERERFRHAKPEITGEYFLAGGHGDIDSNMLPQFVHICPAYGAGWEQLYQKTDNTVSYEGS
jgi:hypothetical protein